MDFFRLLYPGHNGDPVGWIATDGSTCWGLEDGDEAWEEDDALFGLIFGFIDTEVVAVRSDPDEGLPPVPSTE